MDRWSSACSRLSYFELCNWVGLSRSAILDHVRKKRQIAVSSCDDFGVGGVTLEGECDFGGDDVGRDLLIVIVYPSS